MHILMYVSRYVKGQNHGIYFIFLPHFSTAFKHVRIPYAYLMYYARFATAIVSPIQFFLKIHKEIHMFPLEEVIYYIKFTSVGELLRRRHEKQ